MQVTVISPEASMFDGEADAVVAPAFDGQVGILPNHAPFMTLLGEGTLTVRQARTLSAASPYVAGSSRWSTTGSAWSPNTFKENLMRRSLCGGLLVAAARGAGRERSAAQETGTPMFKAPYRAFTNHEFGASFSDPGEGVELRARGLLRLRHAAPTISASAPASPIPTAVTCRILLGGDFRTRV